MFSQSEMRRNSRFGSLNIIDLGPERSWSSHAEIIITIINNSNGNNNIDDDDHDDDNSNVLADNEFGTTLCIRAYMV